MSLFGAAFEIVGACFDILYGEPVQWLPQVDDATSEYVEVGPDPLRPSRDLVGIFDDSTVISRVQGSGANTHEIADVVAAKSQVDFDAALFPTPDSLPQEGDIFVFTAQTGAPSYKIASVEPDGISRVICRLVPL